MIWKQGKNSSVSRIERVLWRMTYKCSLSQIANTPLSGIKMDGGILNKCFCRRGAADLFFEKSKGGWNRTMMLIPV